MPPRCVLRAGTGVLCLLAAVAGMAAATSPEERTTRRIWGPAETVSFWSGALTRSIDGDGSRLHGFTLAREIFDEAEADMGGGLWGSVESGDHQTVVRAGFDFRKTLLKAGPVRVAPLFALGLEHRRRSPDMGLDGLVTGGLDLSVWLSETVQIGLFADRQLGFRSPTRNETGLVLRIGTIR